SHGLLWQYQYVQPNDYGRGYDAAGVHVLPDQSYGGMRFDVGIRHAIGYGQLLPARRLATRNDHQRALPTVHYTNLAVKALLRAHEHLQPDNKRRGYNAAGADLRHEQDSPVRLKLDVRSTVRNRPVLPEPDDRRGEDSDERTVPANHHANLGCLRLLQQQQH